MGASKRLLIRADASVGVGHGHVLRMLALAQAWQRMGGEVYFVWIDGPQHLVEKLKLEGCEFRQIPKRVQVGSITDASNTAQWATELGASVVVLDGYGFGEAYAQALKAQLRCPAVCVVDAEPSVHLLHFADAVLYPGFVESTMDANASERLWKGRDFVLIRNEFIDALELRVLSPALSDASRAVHLLIGLGGSDPCTASELILAALLKRLKGHAILHTLKVRLIVGGSNPHLHALERLMSQIPSECGWELCLDVSDMPAQLQWADGVITAAGGMFWEWQLFQLPGAIVAIADNQCPLYHHAVASGWATGLGDLAQDEKALDEVGLNRWIDSLLAGDIQTCSVALIDGLGAQRTADRLMALVRRKEKEVRSWK
ncbi:MAG: hypothetical protein ABQ298_06310 [Puniceicoccaceae bacterium]